MTCIKWELPIKVKESNRSEHWSIARKRHKAQQLFVRCLFKNEANPVNLPCTVILTRIGPKVLDAEENLPYAFKWIKDEIGACLLPDKVIRYKRNGRIIENKGHTDDDPRITWKYAQEKGKNSIRIEIISQPTAADSSTSSNNLPSNLVN